MPTIPIHLGPRSYDVLVGEGVLSEIGPRAADLVPGRRAFVVVDVGVPATIVGTALASLEQSGFTVTRADLKPSEANKSIDTVSRLLHQIAQTRHERTDPVIAIGGGIVGDVAGFVAASYRRGVPVIQCPTTLLAMVDASVGGKTGVNLVFPDKTLKNMVGAFWQPRLVVADIFALASLPERHLRAGLAECVKHGLISVGIKNPVGRPVDADLFTWTNANLLRFRMGDAALLEALIARNVAVKAAIVTDDEREEKPSSAGGRALLNLGHTFGHAIESFHYLSPDGDPRNAPVLHGEAVALGLVAAAAASRAMNRLAQPDEERIRVAVERLGMESRVVGLPPDDKLIEAMSHDKKSIGGSIRVVVPASLGVSEVIEKPPLDAIRAGWDAIRAHARR
ncbi:MAG TPA: 3-dehydroquinate synthase family protein [Phycisphaerales bacterium]|nr:3-dehydroquinate synthase family protein [Phycisphaerales bacterium]